MPTLEELLRPEVIFEGVVNRIKPMGAALQRFWGFQLGGPNTRRTRSNYGSYDVFDATRNIATARGMGTPPGTTSPQAIARIPVTLARAHQKIPLDYTRLHTLRTLGQPSTSLDNDGVRYLTSQEAYLAMHFANFREFLTAGMMRGSFTFTISGEDWIPTYTGGDITVDMQIPSTNKGTVNGIIPATRLWSDTINSTPFEDINAINAYAIELTGWSIRHIWCNSVVWGYVTKNAGLKERSGTSNITFTRWERQNDASDDAGLMNEVRVGEIAALPGFLWHIYDGGLNVNGTFTKFFPDSGVGSCVFTPESDNLIAEMLEGTEHVMEDENGPAVERDAPYFWRWYTREPARVELVGLDLAMPALKIRKAIFPATVA